MITLAVVMSSSAAVASKRAALGFFSGVKALFGGLGFIVTRPSMWGWSMIPIIAATLLFTGFTGLAIWGSNELSHHLLGGGETTASAIGMWALRVVLWLVSIVVAFLVAMSLAQPLSGFALEAIARRQELDLTKRQWPDQPFIASTLRSLRVSVAALAVSLPILAVLAVISILVPPLSIVTIPLKFLVTGLTAAYDFIDYPLSLRGSGVRSRLGFMKEHFWAVTGFGVAAALLLLIPGFGLFLLPFGVAGATRLIVEADQKAARGL